MKKKIVGIFVCTLLISTTYSITVPANDTFSNNITVDDDGDGDYTSIQDAVDSANSGDTIEVYAGRYVEGVVIEKSLSLIGIDEELGIGDDSGKPVIDGDLSNNVVVLGADGISIEGFDIVNSNNNHNASGSNNGIIVIGIPFSPMKNCQIKDCRISNNHYGVNFWYANDNSIINCIVSNNSGHGLLVSVSDDNKISECTFTNNGFDFGWGICLAVSTGNEFVNCNVASSIGGFGIVKFYRRIFNNGIFQKNLIQNCNFIDNAVNTRDNCFGNNWDNNYYDDWRGLNNDFLSLFPYHISNLNFDMNPSKEPYDIELK